jgi:ABC-type Fe3+-hydroxamate transport system substrate-binding protein
MKKDYSLLLLLFILAIAVLTSSCTSNQNARIYGGTETVNLEAGQRVVNVTWKGESDLWILTKQDTTTPTTYTFQEKSNWGLMEGKVILVEK